MSTPRDERFELTLVVIGTDCTDSCKSNYHTIMAMTASRKHEKDKSTNNDLQNTAHKQTKD